MRLSLCHTVGFYPQQSWVGHGGIVPGIHEGEIVVSGCTNNPAAMLLRNLKA